MNLSEIVELIHEHENAHHKYVMSIDDKSADKAYDEYAKTTKQLLTIMLLRTPTEDEVDYATAF